MHLFQQVGGFVLVGIGATMVMDVWALLMRAAGQPVLQMALLGRWAGHLVRGRFWHAGIGKSPAIRYEVCLGWLVHYATGVLFAGLLALFAGPQWLEQPTLWPALLLGLGTVSVPFLLLQPAMGAGIAASRTPNPAKGRLLSVLAHTAFGLGLYIAGEAGLWFCRFA